jgi:transposase
MTGNTLAPVVAGVDTHADTHHAAVISMAGQHLGDAPFPATAPGYQALITFIQEFGTVTKIGVEGTNSYGADLTRHLIDADMDVVEVLRPKRQVRRSKGKTDPIDAYQAAMTALAGENDITPKDTTGPVEQLRHFLLVRNSAVKAATATIDQLQSLLVTSPETIRARYRDLDNDQLIATLVATRPGDPLKSLDATIAYNLRVLAKRYVDLTKEADTAYHHLDTLTRQINLDLATTNGVGPICAAQLLVTAGSNPTRIKTEAAFAALCGVSPVPASSGKTNRHRVNRGGDRAANAALYTIVLSRMRWDPRTKNYVAAQQARGKTKKEIIRNLKRAVAREIFHKITNPHPVPTTHDLQPLRKSLHITQKQAADHLNTNPETISRIEHATMREDTLTTTYRQWLHTQPNPQPQPLPKAA